MGKDLKDDGRNEGVHWLRPSRLAWLSKGDSPGKRIDLPDGGILALRLTHVAVLMGMIVALVGAGYLSAWLGGYLTQRGLTAITMKTNAALCLTLVGVALMLLVLAEAGPARRWAARVCAVLALLVGLLTLVENLSGWGFGIDQLLAVETPGALAVVYPNRMGIPASLSFTLIGLALLILSRRDRRGVWVMQALALSVCLIALLPTIGFLYDAKEFYGIARYTGIAWPTALALLLLGVGLLCARPAEGLMAQVTADDPGGVSIRRLLPAFVILLLLLGWLRLAGERAGVFDAATGTGMMMLLFVMIFSALTYHASRGASRSAQVLRESEERFRALVTASSEVLYRMSPDWSEMCQLHSRGFLANTERPSRTWLEEYVPPDDQPHVTAVIQEAIRTKGVFELEHRVRRADGSLGWMFSRAVPLMDANGEIVEWFGSASDISEQKQAEETLRKWNETLENRVTQRTAELRRRTKQLQMLALELSQAEERERRRIAVILHEDLQQQIAGAKFHLNLVRNQAKDDRQRTDVDRVDEMLKEVIEKSRSLSYDLSPAVLHMNDLAEVLQWLASRVGEQHGLIAHVDVSGEMTLQSEPLTMFLFRAVQEMLFNVVKHARVNEAVIRVRRLGRYVCLCVSDQGRGFDPRELKETSGFGLLGIRERTELLGGRMKIKSVEGQGSSVRIVVPDGPKAKGERKLVEDVSTLRAASSAVTAASSGSVLRVLLVDDHEIVRQGLGALLQESPGIIVVGEAADGREAINMTSELRPDVVIMDVSMPLMSGDEATRQIKMYLPETRVIALSMYDEPDKMDTMYKAGAEGYVLKTASAEELLGAIRGKKSDSQRHPA